MGIYRLRAPIVDSARRKAQDAANPPSFSGDLTPIIDAAQKLADEEAANSQAPVSPPTLAPADSTTPAPVAGGGGDDGTSIGCSKADSQVAYFAYTYEMEISTASSQSDGREIVELGRAAIQKDLEESLNQALASELLYCPNLEYFAGGDDTGIVEFNSLPVDKVAKSQSCDPAQVKRDTNICYVMNGEMQVWFHPDSDRDIIEFMVLTGTQQFLQSPGNIPGLVRTRYLGPPITNPDGAEGGGGSGPNIAADTSSNGLGSRSIIFMSLASVGFIGVFSFVMYFRLRKSARRDDVPYVATLENESSGEESPSRLDISCEDSNFSSILPSNYKMSDASESPFNSIAGSFSTPSFGQSSMGTIHETDDVALDGKSDIVVSDGYSTEGDSSTEFPYFESNYVANATPVLGARPRTGEELEESLEVGASAAF
jgi:hypothetical protein